MPSSRFVKKGSWHKHHAKSIPLINPKPGAAENIYLLTKMFESSYYIHEYELNFEHISLVFEH